MLGELPKYNIDIDKKINYERLSILGKTQEEAERLGEYKFINNKLQEISTINNIVFANPIADIEDNGSNFSYISESGTPNYMDSNHISVYGGQNLEATISTTYNKKQIIKKYFGIQQ